VPVGRYVQDLIRLRRTAKGLERESLLPVRFVPMVPEGETYKDRPEREDGRVPAGAR